MRKTNGWIVPATFAALLSASAMSALATDYYWTNTLGGDFAGAGNWSPAGPPGAADNANFTNNAAYPVTFSSSPETVNAYFDAPGGTVTQAVGAGNTWLLNTGYVVGRAAGSTTTVRHVSGTLAVTNADGTAELKIGEAGKGTFILTNSGSVVTADRLILTNAASSNAVLSGATLNTLRGSTIANWMSVAGTWNMQGGTNTRGSGLQPYGGGARIIVMGAGTVSTGGYIYIDHETAGNRFVVTNGAKVYGSDMDIGDESTLTYASGGGFDVVGTGSVLQLSGHLHHEREYPNANIVNGGVLRVLRDASGGGAGDVQLGGNEYITVTVSGLGSVWTNAGKIDVGWYGNNNRIMVSGGGLVYAQMTHMSYLAFGNAGADQSINVTGSGSAYMNSAWCKVEGIRDTIQIANGGSMYVGTDLTMGYYFAYGTDVAVNVTGTGSVLRVAGGAYVGGAGRARLSVSNGTMYVTNASYTALLNVPRGTLTLAGAGVLTVDRFIATNGANSGVTINSGTLNVRTSYVNNAATLVIGNGASNATLNLTGGLTKWNVFANGLVITNNAILTGVGTIQAGVTNYGAIQPGGSAGQITITGALNLASSSALNMEIGGYAQSTDYDYVLVQGPVTLGGALNVSSINGFDLAAATNFSAFTVMASTNLIGAFTNVPNGAVVLRAGNKKLLVNYGAGSPYDPNQVVLSLQPARGTIVSFH